MRKFDELKRDVKTLLMSELSSSLNFAGAGPDADIISRCGERLSVLEETTIKYLMKLTNDYIRAKKENIKNDIECDLELFKKYGFDAQILDKKIGEISYHYNINNEIWPSKAQEEIMQTVFSYFECPGNLPKVDTILDIASKFGATYGATEPATRAGISDEIRWLNVSRYFDDPYDTCKFFSTALNNGLSVVQIIELTQKLNSYMDYYDAPRGINNFYNPRVTSIVSHLNDYYKHLANYRARNILQVADRRLPLQANNAFGYNNSDEVTPSKMHR